MVCNCLPHRHFTPSPLSASSIASSANARFTSYCSAVTPCKCLLAVTLHGGISVQPCLETHILLEDPNTPLCPVTLFAPSLYCTREDTSPSLESSLWIQR